MDQERAARLDAVPLEARLVLGSPPGIDDRQQFLADRGINGVDAVLVTQQVLGVSHRRIMCYGDLLNQ